MICRICMLFFLFYLYAVSSIFALVNPAATYANKMGYQTEIVDNTGYVVFPDGSKCEQWDFYRGLCKDEWSYCELNGFSIQSCEDCWTYGASCIDRNGNEVGTLGGLVLFNDLWIEKHYTAKIPYSGCETPAPAPCQTFEINDGVVAYNYITGIKEGDTSHMIWHAPDGSTIRIDNNPSEWNGDACFYTWLDSHDINMLGSWYVDFYYNDMKMYSDNFNVINEDTTSPTFESWGVSNDTNGQVTVELKISDNIGVNRVKLEYSVDLETYSEVDWMDWQGGETWRKTLSQSFHGGDQIYIRAWAEDKSANANSITQYYPSNAHKVIIGTNQACKGPNFIGNIINTTLHGIPTKFKSYWNKVTPENSGKWETIEPENNIWNWEPINATYEYAKGNKTLPFKQHTFIWGAQFPEWITDLKVSELKEELKEWINEYAREYPNIDMIDVVNEPLHNPPFDRYKQSIGGDGTTGWDWVIWGFEYVQDKFPNATLLINDYGIINDKDEIRKYMQIINHLRKRELIDGIGIQCHSFSVNHMNKESIQENLDYLSCAGLPIYITELDITGDEQTQLSRYNEIFTAFWEHPNVAGITLWGYREGEIWKDNAYLLYDNGTEREALTWLKENYLMGTCHNNSIPWINLLLSD